MIAKRRLLATVLYILALVFLTQCSRARLGGDIDYLVDFATMFIERRNHALVEPAHLGEIAPLSLASDTSPIEIKELHEMYISELAAVRRLSHENASRHFQHTHFTTNIDLLWYRFDGAYATLHVREWTHLYFDQTHRAGPEFSGFASNREFVFRRSENGWTLVQQGLLGDYEMPPPNEPMY